jgi:hypothetical protein
LLEDDALITEFSVTTDRLLQGGDSSEVVLIIEVETKAIKRTWKNAFL